MGRLESARPSARAPLRQGPQVMIPFTNFRIYRRPLGPRSGRARRARRAPLRQGPQGPQGPAHEGKWCPAATLH